MAALVVPGFSCACVVAVVLRLWGKISIAVSPFANTAGGVVAAGGGGGVMAAGGGDAGTTHFVVTLVTANRLIVMVMIWADVWVRVL